MPFDEVWNPGFMPLDMVFKGVPSKMAADRPMAPPQAPRPQVPPQAPRPQAPPPQAPPSQAPPQGAEEVDLVLVYALGVDILKRCYQIMKR